MADYKSKSSGYQGRGPSTSYTNGHANGYAPYSNGGGKPSGYGGSGRGGYTNGYGGGYSGGGSRSYGNGGFNGRPRDVPLSAPGPITIRKDFGRLLESGPSSKRDRREVDSYLAKEQITCRGRDVPKPCLEFTDVQWNDRIIDGISKQGYEKPTPIQAIGWAIALAGRDMVGIAQTGSGKTMAYTLPAFVHIDSQPRERRDWGPMVLVLAPTRELAQQIQEVIQQFNVHKSVCVFGGASKGPQIKEIQRNRPMIVVATPGRLNDYLESGIISMSNISFLVLDEADRMLDMGFEPQIRKIICQIPAADRHTLMWSATWPKEVQSLAEEFLKDYIQINVGALALHANHNITQIVDVCDELEKPQKLFTLLSEIHSTASGDSNGRSHGENKTIIFAETKRKVDELTRSMRQNGFAAMCIHGDKSQQERDWVLREFKAGRSPILVATDVAARGLDVDDIKYVINFDYPNCSEDYVHRIGRTGRRDKRGTAYTFFTRNNSKQAHDLIAVLREANQVVNPKLLECDNRGGGNSRYGGDRRRWGYAPRGGNSYGGSGLSGFKRKFDENGYGGGPAKRPNYGAW